MEVVLVPSTVGGGVGQFLSTYLLNGRVAIDAGGLGLFGTPAEQARVGHVFLTHTHIDHVASLPILLDNVYRLAAECITVHASRFVLDSLQTDLLNDRLMPDLFRLSREQAPFLRTAELEAGVPVEVNGLRLTPVPVDHVVPTFAFLVEDDEAAVAVVTDTAPTEAVWDLARRTPRLRGVFLEATFPEAEGRLAAVSKHLTPRLFAAEVAKLPPGVPVIAVHIKPRHYAEVVAELAALGLPNVQVGEPGRCYRF